MTVYKRTFFNIIKHLGYTVLFAAVGGVILYMGLVSFTDMDADTVFLIAIGLAVLIVLYKLYDTFMGRNVRIELTPTELKYFKNNKLKGTYELDKHTFGYRTVSDNTTTDTIDLRVYNVETEKEIQLNCEPLGTRQFHKMFDEISSYQDSTTDTVTLEAN